MTWKGSSRDKSIVVGSLLLWPVLLWLAWQAQTNTEDLNNWIDSNSAQYASWQQFVENFQNDDEIFISWPGCTEDDPRLASLAADIRQQDDDGYFSRVITGSETVKRLTEPPIEFSAGSARRRLRGSFFANDLKTTCLIARLSAHGFTNRKDAMQVVRQAIHDHPTLAPRDVHMAGKTVASVSINEFTNRTLLLGIPGAVMAVLVMYLCLGNLRLTLACGYVAAMAGVTSLALVPLFGCKVNGLLVLMPVLVFVLSLSATVHLIRSLQRFLQQGMRGPQAVNAAVVQTRRPIILSLLTTAVGLGSLCISNVSAVVQFGLFSAASLLLALAYVLILLPAVCRSMAPVTRRQASSQSDITNDGKNPDSAWQANTFFNRLMTSENWSARRRVGRCSSCWCLP